MRERPIAVGGAVVRPDPVSSGPERPTRRRWLVVAAAAGAVLVGGILLRATLFAPGDDTSTSPVPSTVAEPAGPAEPERQEEDGALGEPSAPAVDGVTDAVATGSGFVVEVPAGRAPDHLPRLPDAIGERWSVGIGGAVGDGVVVLVLGDVVSADRTRVVVLDALDGSERWRTTVDRPPRDVDVVAVRGGVVVLDVAAASGNDPTRSVAGLATDTGRTLWERSLDGPGVPVALVGTPLLARPADDGSGADLFDDATGADVGRLVGDVVATDGRGVWFAADETVLRRYDLAGGWRPPTTEARLDPLDAAARRRLTVVDGVVLTVIDGGLVRLDADGSPTPLDVVDASAADGSGDDPARLAGFVVDVDRVEGDALVFSSGGSVVGAALHDDAVEVRWRRTGVVLISSPTDRGGLVMVGRDGGAQQSVVDAVTGRTITELSGLPSAVDVFEPAANGVIAKRPAAIGSERVAIDLDGTDRWSLIGEQPVLLGDRLVVAVAPGEDGVAVTAYADSAADAGG